MTNSQTKDNPEVPNHTDKIDDLLRCVRDAGATDDNFGGEDWTLSDKVIDEAKAQLRNYISEEIKAVLTRLGDKAIFIVYTTDDIKHNMGYFIPLDEIKSEVETARNRGHNV
jgi:hypothetical protein